MHRPASQAQGHEGQEWRGDAAAGNRPQQPLNVETSRIELRVQRVALGVLQPTAPHAVILLGMADQWLDGIATLEPAPLLISHGVQVQRRDHHPDGKVRPAGIAEAGAYDHRYRMEKRRVVEGLTPRTRAMGKQWSQTRLDLHPRHPRGGHRQRTAKSGRRLISSKVSRHARFLIYLQQSSFFSVCMI